MTQASLDQQASHELNDTDALRVEVYGLLAGLLRQAPDQALLDWLASLEIEQDGGVLAERWAQLVVAAAKASPDTLSRAHFRHLIGVVEGDVIPYASWYRNGELMDEALVALRRDLKVLGFERAGHTNDPEDHLAALCEVMAMLIESRSFNEARFFMTHIAPWAASCMADLGRVSTEFYACLGRLGQAFIESEQSRLESEASRDPVRIVEP
ncbi:MAG TPA: molecular chaperone TorD family protein [Halomonas sp.]|nr:molecular chaperone TorD family protein [Halomonas sp.]